MEPSGLDYLSSSLKREDLVLTKKELGSLELFSQKFSYPYEYFSSIDDNYKPINQPKTEHCNNVLHSSDSERGQRTFEIIIKKYINDGKELTLLYLKSDVCLLLDFLENFIKLLIAEYEINLIHFVSVPEITWQFLPYEYIQFLFVGIKLNEILVTDDCAETSYFLEVDMHYQNKIRKIPKTCLFVQ